VSKKGISSIVKVWQKILRVSRKVKCRAPRVADHIGESTDMIGIALPKSGFESLPNRITRPFR